MKKISLWIVLFSLCTCSVISAQSFLVITDSRSYTLLTGTSTIVYGNSDINNLVLQKNSSAVLHAFQGKNTVTIESDYDLFAVSRSGTTVTLQGDDGTLLVIPATTTPQTIIFNNNQKFDLLIDSGHIWLGDHKIPLSTSYYQIADYFPMAGSWETDERTLFMGIKNRNLNGMLAKELMDTSSPKASYWTCDENGLRNLGGYDPNVETGIEDEFYIESTPIIFAKATVEIGDKSITPIDDDDGTTYVSVLFDGTEDITVPAGTFRDCLRFKATIWNLGQNEGDNGYETIWLARNVGFVKAVNEMGGFMFFSPANKTRQLLSYYIPTDLSADQTAIQTLVDNFVDAKENEDLPSLMALYSENFFQQCRNKSEKQAQEQEWFNNYTYNKFCAGIEEIIVSGDRADAMLEVYIRGTVKGNGVSWQYAGRDSVHFIKKNGDWYFYGSQMQFHPYGDTGYFAIFTRNQEWGDYAPVVTGFHDCGTQNLLSSTEEIETFTLTMPAPFNAESIDLMNFYEDEYTEFWGSIPLSYDEMSNGFYTFTVTDTSGNFYSYSDYFEKRPLMDVPVHISPIDGAYLPPGDNIFSWETVPGTDVSYRIELQEEIDDSWVNIATINLDSTSYTFYLEAGSKYQWRVRAMQNDRLGGDDFRENEARSDWDYLTVDSATIQEPVSFTDAYLQYRAYENGTDKFQGWCTFERGEDIIYSNDINSVVLKDASGTEVPTRHVGLYMDTRGYYFATLNDATGQLESSGPYPSSGFSVNFPAGTDLVAGEYTYETETSEGETLTFNLYFPGKTILPFPSSNSMTHTWEIDGSLTLAWIHPKGKFDQIILLLFDQNWKDIFYISLHHDTETINIPAWLIDDIQCLP